MKLERKRQQSNGSFKLCFVSRYLVLLQHHLGGSPASFDFAAGVKIGGQLRRKLPKVIDAFSAMFYTGFLNTTLLRI